MKKCPTCETPWEAEETITESFQRRYSKEGVPDYILRDNPLISVEEAAAQTARAYGCTPERPVYFGKDTIGVEVRGEYDGILYYECMKCKTYHNRFSGRAYTKMPEEHETPYNREEWLV